MEHEDPVECAMKCLLEAEKIKKDPAMIKQILVKLDSDKKVIKSISDIKKAYAKISDKENENGEESNQEEDDQEDQSEEIGRKDLLDILKKIESNTSFTDDEKSSLREYEDVMKKSGEL